MDTKRVVFITCASNEIPDIYYGEEATKVINNILMEVFFDIEMHEKYGRCYQDLLEDIVNYGYLRGEYVLDDNYLDAVFVDIDFNFNVGEINKEIARKLLEQMREA